MPRTNAGFWKKLEVESGLLCANRGGGEGDVDVRLKGKQGAHPEPVEGTGGGVGVGYVAHKGVVGPAYVHVHCALEEAGDEGRRVEGLHIEEERGEKMEGEKEKAVWSCERGVVDWGTTAH